MALYKTLFHIALKDSRLFSMVRQSKNSRSWFKNFKQLPALSVFKTSSHLNREEWTNLRTEIQDLQNGMILPNLDVIIIQLCNSSENYSLGKSYFKYLQENGSDINTALIGKYFQLIYNSRDTLTDLDKKDIVTLYDNLRLKYPLLDSFTAESCILAISVTERWKEVVKLLEMIKISCSASGASYSAIIVASFENNEADMGWKYFHELLEVKRLPHVDTYIAYIDYCSRNFKEPDIREREIGKLFQFMGDYDLLPDKIVMDHIVDTFKTLGWVGTFSELTNDGVCRKCGHKLDPLKISQEDFTHLSTTVLDRVLIGDNIYFKSTPYELKKFLDFVKTTKPYNVVIDGLNVAYKNRNNNSTVAAKQLASVVRYFHDKNQVVLVLGRKHMMKWNQQIMNYIKNNAFLFLTDDLSLDDPCLLYATLASGPGTKFVSCDLMRQHKSNLSDHSLKRLFKQWQMSHQCFVLFQKEKCSVIPPLNYLPVSQGAKNCWHIPYSAPDRSLAESYEPPTDWLCLKRVKSPCK